MADETKQAVLGLLRSDARPIWWISLEGQGVVGELGESPVRHLSQSSLGVVEFGSGEIRGADVLGTCHAHGAWVGWPASS